MVIYVYTRISILCASLGTNRAKKATLWEVSIKVRLCIYTVLQVIKNALFVLDIIVLYLESLNCIVLYRMQWS